MCKSYVQKCYEQQTHANDYNIYKTIWMKTHTHYHPIADIAFLLSCFHIMPTSIPTPDPARMGCMLPEGAVPEIIAIFVSWGYWFQCASWAHWTHWAHWAY